MPALMKFLGGLQVGSEVLIPPGEYLLGSGDEADIALADVAARPRHAVLRIRDDAWEIEPLDGAEVRLDGRPVEGARPVLPYQVLSLGGSHFALGPDGPWETLPAIPQPQRKSVPDEKPAAGEAADAAPRETPAIASAQAGEGTPIATVEKKSRPWLWFALLLLAAGAAAGYWYHNRAEDPGERLADKVRERLAAAGLAAARSMGEALPPGTIGVEPTSAGGVRLSGLLATDADKSRAAVAAGLAPAELKNETHSVEDSVRALTEELARFGPSLRVAPIGNGFSILLFGVVETASDAEAANRLARRSLEPGVGLRRRLWNWRELAREAEREAERLGIPGARFVKKNGLVTLEADTPPSAEMRRELSEALAENLGQDVADYLAAAFKEPEKAEPARDPILELPPAPDPEESAPPEIIEVPEADEPAEAPQAETEPEVAEEPPVITPLAEFWQVRDLYRDGFRDHTGRVWRIGDALTGGLRVAAVWRNGVVFQRGDETLLVPRDAVLFGNSDGNE